MRFIKSLRPKKPKYFAPSGTRDILPNEQKYWERVEQVVKDLAKYYGFQRIETPIFEETEIFSRGIGIGTDIIEKQMYSFRTKGGHYLTLRPEGTAPVVRAYIEHGMVALSQPVKLFYIGPMFRYERPQAGRYRQFYHFGFEYFGEMNPVTDAEIIQLSLKILEEIGFNNLRLEINSIGCSDCRPYFKKVLVNYYRKREKEICPDCRKRITKNPLRVLDCKQNKCARIRKNAPQIIDHLCEECHNYLKETLEFLDDLKISYFLNPYLVRGLDYYTKTVFEIFFPEPGQEEKKGTEIQLSKNALMGGGRYDNLVKLLRGRSTPAVGVAGGIERIIEEMKSQKFDLPKSEQPKVFLAQIGDLGKKRSLALLEEFRRSKVLVAQRFDRGSLKNQLKVASDLRVKYCLILGQKEAIDKTIIIRKMDTGSQKIVKIDKVVKEMKKKLKK